MNERIANTIAVLCLASCAGARDVGPAPSAALTGAVDVASFPSAVTSIDAINETGIHLSAELAANGAFRVALPVGHTYRLLAMRGWDSDPVLFRHGTEYGDTVEVRGGASTVSLGAVRYYAAHALDASEHAAALETCDGVPNAAGEAAPPKRELASATQPKAIPERTPPTVIYGCAPRS